MAQVDEFNQRLKDRYGLFNDGQPLYRVVWSTDLKEKRRGEIEEWYKGLYVRTYRGIGEFPKYSYCPDRWILEIREISDNPELCERITYEPLWVFQDKDGEYLPLNWDAIVAVITARDNRPERTMKTWKDEIYAEQQALEKDKARMRAILDTRKKDHFDWKIQDKEAVFMPPTHFEPSIGIDVYTPSPTTESSDE